MDFHKEVEQVHVYRKDFGAKPVLNSKDSSFDKFCYFVREHSSGQLLTLGGKDVTLFEQGGYEIFKGEGSPDGLKEIWATGTILDGNSSGRFFRDYLQGRTQTDGLGALYKVYGIGDDKFGYRYFSGPKKESATKGKYYQGVPMAQLENPNEQKSIPIENFYDLAGNFGNCRLEGGVEFRGGKKPERLLQIIIHHFSRPGDLVLDSFAGSGTTGAVAHKMNRRWIMIEKGDQCTTHIIPRLRSVVDGSDDTGVTQTVGWEGGGGFRYYHLAPSLIESDRWGNRVISKNYNAAMLAEAMCEHLGFTYAPSPDPREYWKQGYSSERDFIYVTTASLTASALRGISEDVGPERTLLVCCKAFDAKANAFDNLTLKKIPQSVLANCEWGRDDYSLQISQLPEREEDTGAADTTIKTKKARGKAADNGPSLFDKDA